MRLSSSTWRKAAEIQERIERLQQELDNLLQTKGESASTPAAKEQQKPSGLDSAQRRGRRPSLAKTPQRRGRRRGSPSGPLSVAVANVLKARGGPMGVSEILEDLLASGYEYPSPEPKKNLYARIYRLKGVKQVGPGRFAAE